MSTKEQLIDTLNLAPHPEGGFYRETYRSEKTFSDSVLGDTYEGYRNLGTGIYFLLTGDAFSAFHRIKQDELWFFHLGAPIELHMISPEGKHSKHMIGIDIENGESPQLIVPGGYWFAAKVSKHQDYSLVSCTVSPGFDFRDFEMPMRKELCNLFPQHEAIITEFTRK
jgi:predicted cupin superfamily sugar epimerase